MESSDAAAVQVDDERRVAGKYDMYSHIDFSNIENILDFSKPYSRSKPATSSSHPTPSFPLSALQNAQKLTVQPSTKLRDLCTTNTEESSDDESECEDDGRDRPYQCDMCERRFARATHMRRHKRIHTGEKPYSCHICKMRFYRSDYLRNHVYRHQRDKEHHCIVCDEAFYDLTTFTTHCHQSHDEREYFEASSKQKANGVFHKAKSSIRATTVTTPTETASNTSVLQDDYEKDITVTKNESNESISQTTNGNNYVVAPLLVHASCGNNLWLLQFPSGSMMHNQQFIPPLIAIDS
ncbi:protein odd-skipped-related 1-like [Dysidea avara]|uniref:protein odd-skipped-related 1-like n=1 Tax=Dysidea avara TaxID=196820 RepID=UPI003324F087